MTNETAAPFPQRCRDGLYDAFMIGLAALLAYVPAHLVGITEGFWGSIIAISVVQNEIAATEKIAKNQFIGVAIGGLFGFLGLLLFGPSAVVYATAVFLAMLACALLNVASANRIAGIACTIVMLVPFGSTPLHIFLARVGEVTWGTCVGLGIVWIADRLSRFKKTGLLRR